MAQEPTVSIIIAAFRDMPVLEEAIQSALAQTFTDFELLISDDSPEQAVRAMAERHAARDSRVRYRHNETRLGPAGNHWAALREARGRYLCILNHDDRLLPRFLESLVAPLEQDASLVLAFCDHHLIDDQGRVLEARTEENTRRWGRADLARGRHQDVARLVVSQSLPVAMGAVLRKQCVPLGELPADAGPAYDLWLSYLVTRHGGDVWYEPERLSQWRVHAGSLTAAGGADWAWGSARCWAALSQEPLFRPFWAPARQKAQEAYTSGALACLRAQDPVAAREHAREALRFGLSPRLLAVLALAHTPRPLARGTLRGVEWLKRRRARARRPSP